MLSELYKVTQKNAYQKTEREIITEYREILSAQKNPEKFETLYNRYYNLIFVFIYNRTTDKALTAELVSNTFYNALLKISHYTFRGVPFSAWLFRIASNEINQHFRKTGKQRHILLEPDSPELLLSEIHIETEHSDFDFLFEALNSLKPKSLQFVELRFFEKRSFKEIAAILGISENNAKVKTHRVVQKLKKILEKNGIDKTRLNFMLNL